MPISIKSISGSEVTEHNDIRFMSFPAGERHVYLPASVMDSSAQSWVIKALIYSPADVMDLLLVNNALRKAAPALSHLELEIPYLPYARQDRLTVPGESVSLEVMAGLINAMAFDRVIFSDIHSPRSLELVNNSESVEAAELIPDVIGNEPWAAQPFCLVCPDKGAVYRTKAIAQKLGGKPIVYCDKVRNPATGKLTGMKVLGLVPDMPLLLVDDICDAGGTFLGVAKVLREETNQPLYLYVTHGLFTKGMDALNQVFTKVYSAYQKPVI